MSDMSTTEDSQILTDITTLALSEFNGFRTYLTEFRDRFVGAVYDLDDPAQEKAARSDAHAVSTVIGRLDRTHREIKQPLTDAARAVDTRRREIKGELTAIRDGIRDQLKMHAQREEVRKAALADRLAAVRDLAPHPNDSIDVMVSRLTEAQATIIDESWQEFATDADVARAEVIEQIIATLAAARERAAQAAELERLREDAERRDREDAERLRAEQAAAAAAEQKRREQAAADRARVEAEQAAERQRIASAEEAQRVLLAAQREAQAAEMRRLREADEAKEREQAAAARAEQDKLDAVARAASIERVRIAKENAERQAAENEARQLELAKTQLREHRQRIHSEAKESLMDAGISDDVARQVVELVRDGSVAHIRIDY